MRVAGRIMAKRQREQERVQQRARVILLAAKGWQNKDITVRAALDRGQVALWRRRFIESGAQALLQDAWRPGRTHSVTPELEACIASAKLHDKPRAATQWSACTLAAHLGLSATTISRVWARNGLKPHLREGFELSRDPHFVDTLHDIVGLYLNPPEHALVLSCNQESQVQRLERT